MVKPLSFKGDKKTKKRKRQPDDNEGSATTEPYKTSAADIEAPADDDGQNWVSADIPAEIAGPVLLVLPSTPPSCIACDVNGKVFASELENIVEGNPGTAEPHDVRQVWVATKVVGSEGISFKGHHGSANSSAISALESFVPISCPNSPGMISLQICGGDIEAFISSKETPSAASKPSIEIRGDATEISFNTSLRVRMQARFKPTTKSAAAKESKALEKISRKELEEAVGRRLNDSEVKRLRKARRKGNYHEEILDVRVQGKHDKFA
ncbi:uncharacterized protein ARB_06172 [Trichophyton benhamiae CBS 112371]|uniref:FRG1-like family protein n=1 Tax=Arthroderma benhamiae (strain ATCC MYA-4681 / CBS 112371) TaxID=663331 RepID=D4APK4_ARTBC|nr:uncharacterized protein ARB_06172 [Trichophyton benhamiae CBS 112371]EFE35215.1 hypothetical protein ARB_06172 [Trichophyton benhamiae CBS 112371]